MREDFQRCVSFERYFSYFLVTLAEGGLLRRIQDESAQRSFSKNAGERSLSSSGVAALRGVGAGIASSCLNTSEGSSERYDWSTLGLVLLERLQQAKCNGEHDRAEYDPKQSENTDPAEN